MGDGGESRNKLHANPRNRSVYSAHKKPNKTFFRARRWPAPPEPTSVSRNPRQRINRRVGYHRGDVVNSRYDSYPET